MGALKHHVSSPTGELIELDRMGIDAELASVEITYCTKCLSSNVGYVYLLKLCQ